MKKDYDDSDYSYIQEQILKEINEGKYDLALEKTKNLNKECNYLLSHFYGCICLKIGVKSYNLNIFLQGYEELYELITVKFKESSFDIEDQIELWKQKIDIIKYIYDEVSSLWIKYYIFVPLIESLKLLALKNIYSTYIKIGKAYLKLSNLNYAYDNFEEALIINVDGLEAFNFKNETLKVIIDNFNNKFS